MAKRESGARSTKRATPRTAAEDAAGRANLQKGRAKKAQAREEAAAAALPTAQERWAMLLDGTLAVRDLDDAEIRKMRVKSADGTFNGPARRLPSHLAQQFHQEAIRRANDRIRTAAPEAVKELLRIGSDPDVKDSDRIKALLYIIDRSLGKTPEVVRVETEDRWQQTLGEVVVDRNLDDDPRADLQRDADA